MAKLKTKKEQIPSIRDLVAKLSPDAKERMYQDLIHYMSNKIFIRNIIIMILFIITFYLVVMKFF